MRRDIAGRTLIAAILASLHASGVHAFPNRFSVNRTLPAAPRDGFSTFEFDLNLDGTNDLRFSRVDLWATGLPIGPTEIRVSTLHARARVATDEPIPFRETPADAFAGGRSIGPSERWGAGGQITPGDPLFDQPDTSIGVRLDVGGRPHYGWVEVQYFPRQELGDVPGFLIRRAAFETVPDTPIRSLPEPGGIGLLVGIAALFARRAARR